jgi:photosystem II stability/assembly factor-like uncharacterized protein
MKGLPPAGGTVASLFAVESRTGVIFAANNHGLFRTQDAGQSWAAIPADWPGGSVGTGVGAVTYLPE